MCGEQGKCLGALEGIKRSVSNEECHAHCVQTPLCFWSSFDPENETCVLTNDCPALDKTCKDCLASEKGCLIGQEANLNQTNLEEEEAPAALDQAEDLNSGSETESEEQSMIERLREEENEILEEGKGIWC